MKLLVKILFVVCALLLVRSVLSAAAVPSAVLSPDAVAYGTVVDAAKAAIIESFNSKDGGFVEYGGLIILRDGHYYYTTPVTQNNVDEVNYVYHHVDGQVAVAVYHIHPNRTQKDPHYSQFSDDDIKLVNRINRPSYVGIDKDQYERAQRTLRVYNKGDPTITEKTPFGSQSHLYADGQLVMVLPPR